MGYNIGFDADGVLFDTELFQLSDEVITFMKNEYGLDVVNENGYGIKDIFGCDRKTELDFWEKFVIKYSLFYKSRTWTKETIDALRSQGHKVYIVTSKACALEKSYRGIGVRLLFELGLKINGIKVDGIEYCDLDNSAESKLDACKRLNISIMVEDGADNIEKLSNDVVVICMNSLNNKDIPIEDLIRTDDMPDVYSEIQKVISGFDQKESNFSQINILTKEEKKALDINERNIYYDQLIEYYSSMPFDKTLMEKRESIIRFIAEIYSKYFDNKYKPIIIGKENLPKEKGYIYVCNHLCDKDMIFLLCELKDYLSSWHPLVKREILEEKVGYLFRIAQSAFVKRDNSRSRSSAMKDLSILLANYYNILIFPEGTYNKTNNNLADFQGVSHVYLSQVFKRPIVNMALTKDYTESPILRIDKPYIVSRDISIDDAQIESYKRLSSLVEKNKILSREKRL